MADTDDKRKWYPEVVTNHDDRCTPGYEPICDISQAVRIKFPRAGGLYWMLLVHPKTVEAWKAYVFLMDRYGLVVDPDGGTHNCRNIGSGDCPSLHAYCLALDLPPNDYKPAAFQKAVLAIRTNSGATVFKNLASINDRMHDEIDCSPADLASGIDWGTVEGFDQGEKMALLPMVYGHGYVVPPTDSGLSGDQSFKKEDVQYLQYLLGVPATGRYDAATVAKVKLLFGADGKTILPGALVSLQRSAFASLPADHDHDGAYVKSVTVTK